MQRRVKRNGMNRSTTTNKEQMVQGRACGQRILIVLLSLIFSLIRRAGLAAEAYAESLLREVRESLVRGETGERSGVRVEVVCVLWKQCGVPLPVVDFRDTLDCGLSLLPPEGG